MGGSRHQTAPKTQQKRRGAPARGAAPAATKVRNWYRNAACRYSVLLSGGGCERDERTTSCEHIRASCVDCCVRCLGLCGGIWWTCSRYIPAVRRSNNVIRVHVLHILN